MKRTLRIIIYFVIGMCVGSGFASNSGCETPLQYSAPIFQWKSKRLTISKYDSAGVVGDYIATESLTGKSVGYVSVFKSPAGYLYMPIYLDDDFLASHPRQGFGFEFKEQVIAFAFCDPRNHLIADRINSENQASLSLHSRLGFVYHSNSDTYRLDRAQWLKSGVQQCFPVISIR